MSDRGSRPPTPPPTPPSPPESPLRALAGKFIVFDGPDGCGKTTQLKTLITRLEREGITVRRLREPGGTNIGEQIREILLSPKNEGMDVICEMLLYMASRAQLVHEQIKPALAAGECVVADRFASSGGHVSRGVSRSLSWGRVYPRPRAGMHRGPLLTNP